MTDFEIFAKPIPKRYSNIFIEFVSLEVLKYMYPDKYYNLQLVDKPDLQDKDNLIGVEVIEAVSNRIAQIDGEFYNYRFGKQLQYEKEKCIEKLKKNGALLDEYGITYPVQNSIDELEILKHAVVKKLEKFDNYDPNYYKSLDLFVMYTAYLMPHSDKQLDKFFEHIAQENSRRFDTIFIFSGGVLITYKTEKNEWSVKHIERYLYDRFMLDVKEKFIEQYLR